MADERAQQVKVLVEMFESTPAPPDETRLRRYLAVLGEIPAEVLESAIRDAWRTTPGVFAPGTGDIYRAAKPHLERWQARRDEETYQSEADLVHAGRLTPSELEARLAAVMKRNPHGPGRHGLNERLELLYLETLRKSERR